MPLALALAGRPSRGRRRLVGLAAALMVLLVVVSPPARGYARPGSTVRVSVGCGGVQANGDSPVFAGNVAFGNGSLGLAGPAMTPDGRFVAFTSRATNLAPGTPAGADEVYRHDRLTGCTVIASVSSSGAPAAPIVVAGQQICPGADQSAISANGRYVAFTSCSQLLDGGPTYASGDVFVHDFATGRTTKVSVPASGLLADGSSTDPSISADGRYIAFQSQATNLAKLSCSGNPVQQALCVQTPLGLDQVYVRDMVRKTTRLVSAAPGGGAADGTSNIPTISANGRYVAFTSQADDLISSDHSVCVVLSYPPPPSASCQNVYRADLRTGAVQLVSAALNGQPPAANGPSGGTRLGVSADGRYVAFASEANGLVPNDTAAGGLGVGRIYVRDMSTGRTTRAWVDSAGQNVANSGGANIALDATGRYVYFDGAVPAGCTSGGIVILHDTVTGASLPADRRNNQGGENPACSTAPPTYSSAIPSASADGRQVAFLSTGANLVRGDTNGKMDVFVRDMGNALGVGSFGAVTVAGAPAFRSTGVLSAVDLTNDVSPALTAAGGKLVAATVAYRPECRDLFVRLSVEQMPLFALASPGLVYGLDFVANGVRYELRAAKTGPVEASFGLFRDDGVAPLPVQTLRGGYGTSGQEVDFAVPLAAIGLERGGRLSSLRAFTSAGAYLSGPASLIDSISLTREA